MNNTAKVFKRVLFLMLAVMLLFVMVACGNSSKKDDDTKKPGEQKTNTLKPTDIKSLNALKDYGATNNRTDWDPNNNKTYDKDAKQYDGKSAEKQYNDLNKRIVDKHKDVEDGNATSSFVKIFALSDADEILARMGRANLTYDEMVRAVAYLSGSDDVYAALEDEDDLVGGYLKQEDDGSWTGIFQDKTTEWRSKKNAKGEYFNAGWSFFDDWDLYDRLKEYAQDKSVERTSDQKDLAGDNAAWQYRSILQKVYTEVKLPGAAAARLATYLLDYAVEIVETQSGGKADDAITGTTEYTYNAFALYCQRIPSDRDKFSGLADYDTLAYLLAFNNYYGKGSGLQKCVTLYGYYYDYNQTYYNVSLADEDEYAKQLKYEKQSTFSDTEWLDYVRIQRKNYTDAYRYEQNFYRTFYETHFGFQAIVEKFENQSYNTTKVVGAMEITAIKPSKTYTSEMMKAITPNGSIDGVMGQLALSDWMWCYGGDDTAMKAYNKANTDYETGKKGNIEAEKKGLFYYNMEQLKIVYYLLGNMTKNQLDSALYYQVYSYSASMLDHMQGNVKNYVYITAGIENGDKYTIISDEVKAKNSTQELNTYAKGKINVIYNQTQSEWSTVDPDKKAGVANQQPWSKMKDEIKTAMEYDYDAKVSFTKNNEWQKKCERLEDLVIARIWSCCKQKVSEADASKCASGHAENDDGTVARKDYDTEHNISQFVSKYEEVLYHIAGKSNVAFNTIAKGYITKESTAIATSTTWTAGYDGTISDLRATKPERNLMTKEAKKITVKSGETFIDEVKGDDGKESDDYKWWKTNRSAAGAGAKDTDYVPNDDKFKQGVIEESYQGVTLTYEYTYQFKAWYLDQNWKYEFSEDDEIPINLKVYAGYNITKTKK